MNKREWTIVLLPLAVTWAIDQVTKMWASELTQVVSYKWLHFVLHHNHGAMLGLFSELPPVLRIVSLSTGGAFLICIFTLLQFLLPTKSLLLRSGMSILLGGILGNVTDRILYGYVVDFLVIGQPGTRWISPVFNLADALQWVGYGMIFIALVREGERLWPEKNARRQYWVNAAFQLRYCFVLMGVGTGFALITGVFSYTYLKVTISTLVGRNDYLADKYLNPYLITFAIISVATAAALFAIGRYISHKAAGPVYAFERHVDRLMEGKSESFKLRAGDDFRDLEVLAEKIGKYIKENQLKSDAIELDETEPAATKVSST